MLIGILGNVAYETGITTVSTMKGMPTTYCASVELDPTKYNDVSPILASAAPDWTDVTDRSLVYTANSIQTWVNGTKLTVCLYVVGGSSQLPRVVWITYQINLEYRTNGMMVGGTIPFDTTVLGSVCAKLKLPVSLTIYVIVELYFIYEISLQLLNQCISFL